VATAGTIRDQYAEKAVLVAPGRSGRADSLMAMHPGGAGFAGHKPGLDRKAAVVDVIAADRLAFTSEWRLRRDAGLRLPMAEDPISTLTPREAEVLRRIAAGQNTKKMALEMNVTTETLRTYVRNVLAKLGAHSRLEAAAIASRPAPGHHELDRDHPLFAALTPREREVLLHLTKGCGQPELAKQLHMSAKTVNTHLHNLRSKLGVHSTLEAVALARSWLGQRAAPRDPG
jgi:DNA-binding NarL/FixJ family response regulator